VFGASLHRRVRPEDFPASAAAAAPPNLLVVLAAAYVRQPDRPPGAAGDTALDMALQAVLAH
jgi:hypothetical protein